MKKRKLLLPAAAMTLLLCACTNTGNSKSTIDEHTEDLSPTPTQAIESTPTPAEVPQDRPVDTAAFEEMACWDFILSSNTDIWATVLSVEPDGSFSGEYYRYRKDLTGPGYPNGSKYESRFHGAFGYCYEESPYIYRVSIDNISYDNPPGTEETKDGMHYIYTDPEGLDLTSYYIDVYSNSWETTYDLLVFLPGAPIDNTFRYALFNWEDNSPFSAQKNGISNYDFPEDLPFCGIYNEACSACFSSVSKGENNKVYLVNPTALPGLENTRYDINSDNTYYIEDMTPDGTVQVRNVCFKSDKDYLSVQSAENEAEFAGLCFQHLSASPEEDRMRLFGYADLGWDTVSSHLMVNGYNSIYAVWLEGSNEDTRLNLGIFSDAGQHSTCTVPDREPGFAYAYAISISMDHSLYDWAAAEQYLLSLNFSGKQDKLSSASEKSLGSSAYYNLTGGVNNNKVLLKKMIPVSVDDADTLSLYGLDTDPDHYRSDIVFVEADDEYTEYDISSDCPLYYGYGDSVFDQPYNTDQLGQILSEFPDGRTMLVLFDNNNEIVMISDPKLYSREIPQILDLFPSP